MSSHGVCVEITTMDRTKTLRVSLAMVFAAFAVLKFVDPPAFDHRLGGRMGWALAGVELGIAAGLLFLRTPYAFLLPILFSFAAITIAVDGEAGCGCLGSSVRLSPLLRITLLLAIGLIATYGLDLELRAAPRASGPE